MLLGSIVYCCRRKVQCVPPGGRVMAMLCGRSPSSPGSHVRRQDESEHVPAPRWERSRSSLEMASPALCFAARACNNQLRRDPLKSRCVGVKKEYLCRVPCKVTVLSESCCWLSFLFYCSVSVNEPTPCISKQHGFCWLHSAQGERLITGAT